MARKSGSRYQNIRYLEDRAIAKADREMQAKRNNKVAGTKRFMRAEDFRQYLPA